MHHCEKNSIVTKEQAAGKRGSWGCIDQLLINSLVQFSSILFNIHKLHNKFTKVVYTNTIHFDEN